MNFNKWPVKAVVVLTFVCVAALTSTYLKEVPWNEGAELTAGPFEENGGEDVSQGAICLVGGAREFELTGPSIQKHLLAAFKNAHVFVVMGLDEQSFKLLLFRRVQNLVGVRLFPQTPIKEGNGVNVLTGAASPKGVQGLLQYFNLVEGCLDLIDSYSLKHSVKYEWVIRTRVDSFWSGPPPPLLLKEETYVVPIGSMYAGLNDRFGFGNLKVSRVALSRLSMLEELLNAGMSRLNSESAFKAELQVRNITVSLQEFNFCIISRRSYGWLVDERSVPVVSLSSKGPMNGAKCRPCTPKAGAKESYKLIQNCSRIWSWPGDNPNLKLCNASGPWEEGWEVVFDRVVGKKLAAERKEIALQKSLDSCVAKFDMLKKFSGGYDGPPGSLVCGLKEWGPFEVLRYGAKNQVPVYISRLGATSIVYSFNFSENWSVEAQVYSQTNCFMYLFQEDFRIPKLIEERPAAFESGGEGEFAFPQKTHVGEELETLISATATLGHRTVDLLMLRVTEDSLPAVRAMLSSGRGRGIGEAGEGEGEGGVSVCQIVVRVEGVETEAEESIVGRVKDVFQEVGFFLVHCKGVFGQEICVFLREKPC